VRVESVQSREGERPDHPASPTLISTTDLRHFVVALRERGVKPVTCNTWIRALNAFCRWLHEQELAAAVAREGARDSGGRAAMCS
jgi:hypothetical protein